MRPSSHVTVSHGTNLPTQPPTTTIDEEVLNTGPLCTGTLFYAIIASGAEKIEFATTMLVEDWCYVFGIRGK